MGWMVEQNMVFSLYRPCREKPILGTDHSWVAPKNTHNIPISQSLIIVVWHSHHMIFPCQPIVSHLMFFFCVNHAWLRSLMIDRLIHIVYPYPVCCHSIFLFGVASQQNLLFLSIFGLYKSSVFRRETATSWAFYGTDLAGFSISCESLAIAGLICGDQDGGGKSRMAIPERWAERWVS